MSRLSTAAAVALMVMVPAVLSAEALAITRTLSLGSRGDEVSALQTLLAGDPIIYPEGLVTGYFGPLTRAAIQRFQASEGIVWNGDETSTGLGLVGPRTRAALARIHSASQSAMSDTPRTITDTISDSTLHMNDAAWRIDENVSNPPVASLDREAQMNALIEKLEAYVAELQDRVWQMNANAPTAPASHSEAVPEPASVIPEAQSVTTASEDDLQIAAPRSVTGPCPGVLHWLNQEGEAGWIRRCEAATGDQGMAYGGMTHSCREWITICKADPTYLGRPGLSR